MIKSLLLPLMAGLAFYAPSLNAKTASLQPQPPTKNELYFIANNGQVIDQHRAPRKDLDFKLSTGNGLNIFIGSGKIEYQWTQVIEDSGHHAQPERMRYEQGNFPERESAPAYLMYRMDVTLIGANGSAQVIKEAPQSYYERYYLPAFPETGAIAHSYRKITYRDIYPHIDWVFYFNAKGQLEHDFVIRPGGKVSDIQIRYGGFTTLSVLDDGALQAITPLGSLKEHAPYSYDASGRMVNSRFVLQGEVLSFAVADYTGTLTIDPTIEWSTYFGGLGSDIAYGLTKDSSGSLYMAGIASSTDNIATTGSYQQTISGNTDGFMAKFTPTGTLLWSTYFGGPSADRATDICFDPVNQALYIAGATQSNAGIATTGAHQAVHGGGYDALLARFDTSGQRVWSTYYGGSSTDGSGLIAGVATDHEGHVFLCSETNSDNNIASPGSHQPARAGSRDGFVAKFNSAGQRQWGTYLGGNGGDFVRKLACDSRGMLYVGGHTGSNAGIATSGAHQVTLVGGNDAFLAQYNTQGVLQWCTYFGGPAAEVLNAIQVNNAGQVAIAGSTQSTTGIATATAAQTGIGGLFDGFLACFNSGGTLSWASYLGGEATDNINCLTWNGYDLYLAGSTASSTGIALANSIQPNYGGGTLDGFVVRFDTLGVKHYATYIGGTDADDITGMTFSRSYDLFLCGRTNSAAGMATAGSHQPLFGGGEYDALLLQLNFCDHPSAVPVITGDTLVCEGRKYYYTVDSIAGAQSYSWQWPETWEASPDTTHISIIPGVESGYLSVTPRNYCATGDTTHLWITVQPAPKPVIVPNGNILGTSQSYDDYQWLLNDTEISGANDATLIAKEEGLYAVRVRDDKGCEGTSAAIQAGGTAVNTIFDHGAIAIYPNPAQHYLRVTAPFLVRVVISGTDGRELLHTNNNGSINLDHFIAGIYIVQVYDHDHRLLHTAKLVKH